VADYGYAGFFVYAALIGIPAIILVVLVLKVQQATVQKYNAF
jgi:PAT family beta-lactamase induction signal transducer AmpG